MNESHIDRAIGQEFQKFAEAGYIESQISALKEIPPPLGSVDEVESQFRAELLALLKRWDAEIKAEDHYTGYAECGEDIRMTVTIPSIWNKDTEEWDRDWTEINLGGFVDSKP